MKQARTMRRKAKLTQRAAAKLLGITASHLCRVERGKVKAGGSLVNLMCRVYMDAVIAGRK